MRSYPDNYFSCVCTDPPYGLLFMGKGWDHEVPGVEYWKECFRCIKPGGHILAMGGSRTFHRLAFAMEESGFELRDTIMWIYGSGFPKSHNHFGISGFGTALKPAYEPIIMAMRPCDGTFKQNYEKWGQAGINIDGCRIEGQKPPCNNTSFVSWRNLENRNDIQPAKQTYDQSKGRWPTNIIFDEEAAKMLDEQSGELSGPKKERIGRKGGKGFGFFDDEKTANMNSRWPGDSGGGASRFFYCAKTSSRERNEGLEGMPDVPGGSNAKGYTLDVANGNDRNKPTKNYHPTVKPLKLMRYLITLIMPPKDGILLDPFAGSGSTIIAAHQLGVKAIGIEKQAEYVEIANKRLEYYMNTKEDKDLDLFDTAV